ncbi:MAG: phytoene desaturase [Alphaproteobacteria bacterium]|nr:phytoene desaturase [Alphaproteobacteria bacterium]
MAQDRVVVIGAGVGGLACAIDLARRGFEVEVLERAQVPGGKVRQVAAAGREIDAGPTVFTLREVFERLFDDAGARLQDFLTLRPLDTLARHLWPDGSRLDLHADPERSVAAVEAFAGPDDARGLRAFQRESRRVHDSLRTRFMEAPLTGPLGLTRRFGVEGLGDLLAIRPFESLWRALGRHFRDPRLRQLFARYATYCGASPFSGPATLMLIAHVEQMGVWRVEGGMVRLAEALAALATRLGAKIRLGQEVVEILALGGRARGVRLATGETVLADAVVFNGDPGALRVGRLGEAGVAAVTSRPAPRSLSAMTWAFALRAPFSPLLHHNVLFGADYRAEFRQITRDQRLPRDPTIYVCAQDRHDAPLASGEIERLFVLVNAPARGDLGPLPQEEIAACRDAVFLRLASLGLQPDLAESPPVLTTPSQFEALYPATGGALYGRAVIGWQGAFQRPGSRARLPGLYLAGGGTHPGAGLPMAAISGRLAAQALVLDRCSTPRSHPAATPGGTSTPRARTDATALS